MKPITQEEFMGCAIACTAFILKLSYQETKLMFENPGNSSTKGFCCEEVVRALQKGGVRYSFDKFGEEHEDIIDTSNIIVFDVSSKYPAGHYFAKREDQWMNPWINFPLVMPAKSGFQKYLDGKVKWIIFPD